MLASRVLEVCAVGWPPGRLVRTSVCVPGRGVKGLVMTWNAIDKTSTAEVGHPTGVEEMRVPGLRASSKMPGEEGERGFVLKDLVD